MKQNFEQLEAYLAGEDISEEEIIRFEKDLESDPELRAEMIDQLKVDQALKVLFGATNVSHSEFVDGVLARLRSEGVESVDFSKSVLSEIIAGNKKVFRWSDFGKAALITALIFILGFFALRNVSINGFAQSVDERDIPLARVQSLPEQQIHWTASSSEILNKKKGWVGKQWLEFTEGVATIDFNSGARAWVYSPARFRVESNNRVFLKSGKITALINKSSEGFTVNTPKVNVVDYGTRFCVKVDPRGETEVHVIEGEVKVGLATANSEPISLQSAEAIKTVLGKNHLKKYNFDEREFSQAVTAKDYKFTDYCDFSSYNKNGYFEFNELSKLKLLGNEDSPVKHVNGVKNQCFISNIDRQLDARLSPFNLNSPFTASCWIKAQTQTDLQKEIIFQLATGKKEPVWTIGSSSLNGIDRLYAQFGKNNVVGSTDLADGDWHHIAVVFIGNERGVNLPFESQVQLYVDGKKEFISHSTNDRMNLGGRITRLQISHRDSGFAGWIDEFKLFNEAVSASFIQDMVEEIENASLKN